MNEKEAAIIRKIIDKGLLDKLVTLHEDILAMEQLIEPVLKGSGTIGERMPFFEANIATINSFYPNIVRLASEVHNALVPIYGELSMLVAELETRRVQVSAEVKTLESQLGKFILEDIRKDLGLLKQGINIFLSTNSLYSFMNAFTHFTGGPRAKFEEGRISSAGGLVFSQEKGHGVMFTGARGRHWSAIIQELIDTVTNAASLVPA